MQFSAVVEASTAAVNPSRSLGAEVLATVPEPFEHPREVYVGIHIVYRRALIGPRFGRRFAWDPFIPVSSPPISVAQGFAGSPIRRANQSERTGAQ